MGRRAFGDNAVISRHFRGVNGYREALSQRVCILKVRPKVGYGGARLCAKHQPQRVEMLRTPEFSTAHTLLALRLVFNTAALRGIHPRCTLVAAAVLRWLGPDGLRRFAQGESGFPNRPAARWNGGQRAHWSGLSCLSGFDSSGVMCRIFLDSSTTL